MWGNLSELTDDGRWFPVRVAMLDLKTLDHNRKIWFFNNKPIYDLERDPLEVWWQTMGTNKLKTFFEYNTKLRRCTLGSKLVGVVMIRNSWKDKGISDDLLKSF